MGSIHEINKVAYQYNESVCDRIVEICKPLFSEVGLKDFCYGRIFDDGRYLRLGTNRDWSRYVFENVCTYTPIFQNALNKPEVNKFYYFLWPIARKDEDHLLSALFNFDIWNGINVIRKLEDSVECYGFATSREKDQICDFYLNNIFLLERFIHYFHQVAADLIKIDNNKKLSFMKIIQLDQTLSMPIISATSKKNFFTLTSVKKPKLKLMSGESISLSPQQLLCLKEIALGKTAKEIANKLDISFRTVQAYTTFLKSKAKLSSRREITEFYNLNFNELQLLIND